MEKQKFDRTTYNAAFEFASRYVDAINDNIGTYNVRAVIQFADSRLSTYRDIVEKYLRKNIPNQETAENCIRLSRLEIEFGKRDCRNDCIAAYLKNTHQLN